MKLILTTLKKILFWSYERGTWQYDIMVVLILAFIFFAPNEMFHSHSSKTPVFLTSEEVGQIEQDKLQQRISELISSRYGHPVEVTRIERVVDDTKQLTGFLAWEK
jgi:hypothetical protein